MTSTVTTDEPEGADAEVKGLTFFFDPSCPWTWRTAQWLVDVTHRLGVLVTYRPFELNNGAPLEQVPEQFRAGATASRGFLRVVAAAHADGADDLVGSFYAAYASKVHDEGATPSPALVREALLASGGEKYESALEDAGLDAAVAEARSEAQQFSGDDTGSPVTVLDTAAGERGFFGPVLAPPPTGADADRLWRVMVSAASVSQFFELKRRRTAQP